MLNNKSGWLSLRRVFYSAVLVLFLCGSAAADIVDSATGAIDLKLFAFFESNPDQQLVVPIGLADAQAAIDGSGYYSVSGLCEVEYNYLTSNPAQTWFTTYTHADTADEGDGGGGYSKVDLSFYAPAPFYYRLEGEVVGNYALSYQVSFNGVSGVAYYDDIGVGHSGTFPIIYLNDDPNTMPIGWGMYVDEGYLPAGLYDFSVVANASLDRYGKGHHSTGLARLLIQMQGDADLDGYVGLEDLDIVLNNWNDYVPIGAVQFGDLTRDGIVGLEDLDQVLLNWNNSVNVQAVPIPEPGTGLLLVVVSLACAGGRPR